ncbi:hypothetical protein [Phyllobacterium zundukense]|uniref:RDD domain-containing protein n=1 Tax=Phyllobacterium zundukense TaxID=1867719 RepID=A0A2N9VVY6_9HYPH|nr:hypothetical protein [Phyllobacterium zundukense]ATU91387.1 hypothetical protein BLM14_06890 [Phyllobacterium zundukense]PIO43654.1 hypothetical protein B5P45_17275 [Phyllobacterium zundukense]
MTGSQQPTAHWRIILAFILDLITAFFVFGFLVATLLGGLTENGFSLDGWPALVAVLLIVVYFVIGKRLGGTLWKRLLGVRS